jgi:hypothetical protein
MEDDETHGMVVEGALKDVACSRPGRYLGPDIDLALAENAVSHIEGDRDKNLLHAMDLPRNERSGDLS